jgi:predicted hydrocarbon binding protein
MGPFNIDAKTGTLTAFNERFLFLPVSLIHSIEDQLTNSFGPVTATLFQYEIGKEGGSRYVRVAEKAGFKVDGPENVRLMAERLGTMSGWGKVEIVDFDFERKLAKVRWTNGVSVRNRNGKTPVCHFGRGILTGATEVLFNTKCESLEVRCQGKGDEYCEALIGEPKQIDRLAESLRR